MLSLHFVLGLERHDSAKRARLDATDALATDSKSTYRYLEGGIATTSSNVAKFSGAVYESVSGAYGCMHLWKLTGLAVRLPNSAAQQAHSKLRLARS